MPRVTYVDATLGQECDSSLRVSRFVLGQEFEFVVLVLEVSNVSVSTRRVSLLFHNNLLSDVNLPLAGEVQAVRSVVPEWHAHSGDRVQVVKATDGLVAAGLPERKLTVTHARESGCRDTVMLAHPNSTAVLRSFMARANVRGLLLTNIPHAQLLVSGRCDQ